MGNRTKNVVISPEGRVLRDLRQKHGLSMRAAGKLMGISDSYISQIENGRADPPKGECLLRFLKVYGDIGAKYFQELCKNWKKEQGDAEAITLLLPKLNDEKLKLLRGMAEQLARQ